MFIDSRDPMHSMHSKSQHAMHAPPARIQLVAGAHLSALAGAAFAACLVGHESAADHRSGHLSPIMCISGASGGLLCDGTPVIVAGDDVMDHVIVETGGEAVKAVFQIDGRPATTDSATALALGFHRLSARVTDELGQVWMLGAPFQVRPVPVAKVLAAPVQIELTAGPPGEATVQATLAIALANGSDPRTLQVHSLRLHLVDLLTQTAADPAPVVGSFVVKDDVVVTEWALADLDDCVWHVTFDVSVPPEVAYAVSAGSASFLLSGGVHDGVSWQDVSVGGAFDSFEGDVEVAFQQAGFEACKFQPEPPVNRPQPCEWRIDPITNEVDKPYRCFDSTVYQSPWMDGMAMKSMIVDPQAIQGRASAKIQIYTSGGGSSGEWGCSGVANGNFNLYRVGTDCTCPCSGYVTVAPQFRLKTSVNSPGRSKAEGKLSFTLAGVNVTAEKTLEQVSLTEAYEVYDGVHIPVAVGEQGADAWATASNGPIQVPVGCASIITSQNSALHSVSCWAWPWDWKSSALAQITDSDFNFAFHAAECKGGKVQIVGWVIH